MTDEQLSALLRLKRYEQPAPEYFDELLENLHDRQRAEILRRPLWKIAVERAQTFFSEHSMSHLSYAGAVAAVLVIGVAAIGLLTPQGESERMAKFAATMPTPAPDKLLSLQTSATLPSLAALPFAHPGFEPQVHQPRYVMDARPASYEPSSAFDF